MTDPDFLRAFETATLPPGSFHHRDHVRAAWLCLRHAPTPVEGLERFVSGLRRFAAAAGKPELYHETITWAFLLLIRERMAVAASDESFDAFAARNADLFQWKPSVLDRYYKKKTLASERARAVFLLPDRLSRPRRVHAGAQ
jgi:hypothetical protein